MSKSFFLTGCASGMGRHLADVFQKQGHCVCATDVNEAGLETTAQELGWPEDRVLCRALDVTDPEAWERVFAEAVERFGHIDVTLNIAGLLLSSWVPESPAAETNAQVDVNVKGVVFGTQVSARHMLARGAGHIINIASIAGVTPVPGLSVYAATKHAVRAFSLSAMLEMRSKGVYVTVICPSTVQTPMLDNQDQVDAAEMFFSGLKILTVRDIERAVMRALRKRPYEVHLPWWRVRFVQLLGLFPWLGPLALPLYQRSGRRRQQGRRAE